MLKLHVKINQKSVFKSVKQSVVLNFVLKKFFFCVCLKYQGYSTRNLRMCKSLNFFNK